MASFDLILTAMAQNNATVQSFKLGSDNVEKDIEDTLSAVYELQKEKRNIIVSCHQETVIKLLQQVRE